MKTLLSYVLFIALIPEMASAAPSPQASKDPKEQGRQIAEASYNLGRSFGDEYADQQMVLTDANGKTVSRKMKTMTLERAGALDYSLIQFVEPADVRGTGLLTYQSPKDDDQQWLYLPDLRRVKRIASSNKSGAFMGSEFSYEDITGNTLDKFSYTFLREEPLNGRPCTVVEKIPTYKDSGYSKILVWTDKESNLVQRQEFFDRKKTLFKTMEFVDWKLYGKTWRMGGIVMKNLQTNKSSALTFSNRKLGKGLKESDFTTQALQRIIQ